MLFQAYGKLDDWEELKKFCKLSTRRKGRRKKYCFVVFSWIHFASLMFFEKIKKRIKKSISASCFHPLIVKLLHSFYELLWTLTLLSRLIWQILQENVMSNQIRVGNPVEVYLLWWFLLTSIFISFKCNYVSNKHWIVPRHFDFAV